ncbi:general transcriptional corepressor CYC8 [Drosophila obscura]|uniref:general transcriptional corepressor CYC8 n=1 Tax=Drosophila obscura TaxID=7282 RepID=UPI001BB1CB86|nr:general transcriptional corepressor CYC8 [Drosophila obscura]
MSSTLNEAALDQHFAAQSRVLGQVLTEQISRNDHSLAQKWLRAFNRACKNDKYARNCLMLLMFGQLKDMGQLSEPFVELENLQLSLQEVLTEYDGNLTDLQESPSEDFNAEDGNAAGTQKYVAPPNVGNYNMAESNRAAPSRMSTRATEPMSKNPVIKQANQLLMNQVKVGLPMSSRAVPMEREPQHNVRLLEPIHTHAQMHAQHPNHMIQPQYRSQHHHQPQQQSQHQPQQSQLHQLHQQNYPMEQTQQPQHPQHPQQPQHPQHPQQPQQPQQQQQIKQTDQNLISDAWNFSLQAIDRLDKWRGSNDKLSFFSLCLRPLIIQEPELRKNIPELDNRLVLVIHQIIDDATASFNAKESAVLQERANQLLRRQELEQLRADLDRREHELRRHEAAIAQNEHPGRSQSPTGDARLYAEERGHPRHLTPLKHPANAPLPAGQCTKCLAIDPNAGAPSGATEGAAAINYVCAQCDMDSSAVTFNSVDFLQGEQGSELPEENQMESMEESANVNGQW